MTGESAHDFARGGHDAVAGLPRAAARREQAAPAQTDVGAILDRLRSHGWTVLHDLHWTGRPGLDIDHVVAGPGGIFVIDSLTWSGRLALDGGVLRHNGSHRPEVLWEAWNAACAVKVALDLNAPVHPVLCFAAGEPIMARSGEVEVCSTQNIVDLITARKPVLDQAVVDSAATVLRSWKRPVRTPAAAPALVRGSGERKPVGVPNLLEIFLSVAFLYLVIAEPQIVRALGTVLTTLLGAITGS